MPNRDTPQSFDGSEADASAWLAAIVASSDDAIVGKRLDGIIVSWNDAATRLFGYSADEIIGRSVLTLIPDDRKHEEPQVIAQISRGERIRHYETIRRRKDGTLVEVSLSVSPILDVHGTVVGAAKIARDITIEREHAHLLRTQQAELERQMEEAQSLGEELEQTNEQLQESTIATEEALAAEMAANDRARRLLAVSTGLSIATTPEEIANVIFRETMAAMEADAGSLALVRGVDPGPIEFEIVRTSGFASPITDRYQRFPLAAGRPLSDAVLSGKATLLESRAEWERRYAAMAAETGALGYEAMAVVPIIAGGRAVAGLTFSFAHARSFDDGFRTFLATLAEQCGLALERGRAYDAERRSREANAFLAEASELLSSSLDYTATLRTVAEACVPRLGDWCAIDVVQDPAERRWPPQLDRLATVHQDADKLAFGLELARRFPTNWASDDATVRALRDAKATFIPVITDAKVVAGVKDPNHLALLRAMQFSSIMIVPLVARDLTLGVLTLCMSESGRMYHEEDFGLAQNLAQRAAIAVDNSRLYREAEAARDAAENANKAKSHFLATMSHELRTPLNAIGGYAELIQLGLRGPVTDQQRDDLARIRKSQKHLETLIAEVLEFARTERGNVRYSREVVMLSDVLANCEMLAAPQIASKGLTFVMQMSDPELRVLADKERVQQIVLNLLTNAVKFTAAGGGVEIRCEATDARVLVHVSDTGRGIAPEHLEAVFEAFVQLDASHTRTHEGVGLGLAISRELARAMGGDLTVTSAVGRGSTFTLALMRA